MNRIIYTAFYRLPAVALYLVIFWQSSYPGVIEEPLFPYDDKVLHFLVYGVLAALTARWLFADNPAWPLPKIRIVAIAAACLFGMSDEIHQAFVPSRVGSFPDFAADCLGSIVGATAYVDFFITRFKRRV